MVDFIHYFIVPAAYAVLPPQMNSHAATAMLLAIGLQESKFEARRQHENGPARGFWQFERGGGLYGVTTHRHTREPFQAALAELQYPTSLTNLNTLYTAIEHNDVLACVCARLLLWTLPADLPTAQQSDLAWAQYLDAWRPGKPRFDSWPENFAKAWAIVEAAT